MPPYVLTVRLPYMLLGADASNDPDRVLDPKATHEKKRSAFYQVDSQDVADKLLELFRYGKPEPGIPGDPTAPVGTLENLRKVVEGICEPMFSVVDTATLDMAQRIFRRQELELLDRIEEVGDWDPGIWEDVGLPHDRGTVLLMQYRHQAQEWEPLVREELGLEKRVCESGDSRPNPGPSPAFEIAKARRKMAATLTPEAAVSEFEELAADFKREASQQTRAEFLGDALRGLRVRGGHLIYDSIGLLPDKERKLLLRRFRGHDKQFGTSICSAKHGRARLIYDELREDDAFVVWYETEPFFELEGPLHAQNPAPAVCGKTHGKADNAALLAEFRHYVKGYAGVCRYMANLIRQEAGQVGETKAAMPPNGSLAAAQGVAAGPGGAGETPDLDSRACGMLAAHPDWSDTKIAKKLPCARTSLYRLTTFPQARAIQEEAKKVNLSRGRWNRNRNEAEGETPE